MPVVEETPQPDLQALVSARQQTLGDRPFKDLAAVEEYGRQTVGVLTRLIVDLLVVRRRVEMSDQVNAAVEVVIAHMAAASGLATHLRYGSGKLPTF